MIAECILWEYEDKKEIIQFTQTDKFSRIVTIKNNRCSYALKFTMKRSLLADDTPVHESEEFVTKEYLDRGIVSSRTFSEVSENNDVEICIDGLQTFGRYYHVSISITDNLQSSPSI